MKSTVVEISQNRLRRLPDFRIDHREVELVLEVLRQRLRRDDRVIHPLAALLVLLGPRRGFPFKDSAVAPVVVGLVHVIQRVRFFGIGPFLVEGNSLG